MGRIVGIQHRVKKSVEGESRPTIVAIDEGPDYRTIELATEQDELDFLLGVFPVRFRKIKPDDSLADVRQHQIRWRKAHEGETAEQFPGDRIRYVEKKLEIADQIPDVFDGIAQGDTVAMLLGGSGDHLAYAASRIISEKGGRVMRIPPFVFADERAARHFPSNKSLDAVLLAALAREVPSRFYAVVARDRDLILASIRYRTRIDAMKARIACEQRLRQRLIGNIFTSADGLYPEGGIEKAFDATKESDATLIALEAEEQSAVRELVAAVEPLDVFQRVFSPIGGMDVKIAARIIASVVDIRQFATVHKFVAYCGAHVLEDGRFARRRNGERANWNADCRQALYLFTRQCNLRPHTEWGQKLREIKKRLREKHPEPVVIEGKRRYSNGHIHQMASWRLATIFARHIYKEWWKLEQNQGEEQLAA